MLFDIDDEIQAYIDEYLRVSDNLSTGTSIEHQRAAYEQVCERFRQPYPADVTSTDDHVKGRHGAINIRRYVYAENHNSDAQMVFIHGGGFVLGSLDSHDDICAELCALSGLNAVSIDYRLSPEFHHPVHLDDIEDAYLACRTSQSILVGASAGATLAAALCHRLKNSAQIPQGQVLLYPSLGGEELDLASYRDNADAPLLSTEDIYFYRKARCDTDEIPINDPEFYPLAADDFTHLPKTIVFTADIDPLRDDGASYVTQLVRSGVNACWHNELGLVHDYLRARDTSQKAADSFKRIGAAIKALATELN